ncbi:MAG: hypothetical protein LBS99_00695 [Clostridiales bacterium]|nr:hypothetical protein [Clostridiales bacterium]
MDRNQIYDSRLDLVNAVNARAKGLITAVLDGGSFCELDTFMYGDTLYGGAVGEGVVSGFGRVNDRKVYIYSQNIEVHKGGVSAAHATKIIKCMNTASRENAPLISIIDTMGARLEDGLEMLDKYSELLSTAATLDVPHICVIKSAGYGMISAFTELADFVIMHENAVTASTSPMIIDQSSNPAGVGGAVTHSTVTGLCDLVYKTDAELAKYISQIVNILYADGSVDSDPNTVAAVLNGKPDAKQILDKVFDSGALVLREKFEPSVITALAAIADVSCGVIITDSKISDTLSGKALRKISEFIVKCDFLDLPAVIFLDSKGLKSSLIEEHGGIVKEYAALLRRLNNAETKIVTVITGAAVGAAYAALASNKNGISDILAWVTAQVSALPSAAAANILYAEEISKAADKDAAVKQLASQYENESADVYYAAKHGYIDNIIEPALTRQYLYLLLREE